jgi:hypothetical protein
MKASSANRDRLYVFLMWKSLRGLITFSSFAIVLLMTIFSVFILVYAESLAADPQHMNDKILWLSKAAWLGICGSIFASTVFWGVQAIIALFSKAKRDTYELTYKLIVEDIGLNTVYMLKGGDEACEQYKKAIARARKRIWAVGMSNRNFSRQHIGTILDLLKRNPSLDVVITFWNPDAYLSIEANSRTRHGESTRLQSEGRPPGLLVTDPTVIRSGQGSSSADLAGLRLPVFVVQAMLEERAPDSAKEIRDRQDELKNLIEKERSLIQGNLRILSLSMVTYISCMIIDQDVFFFPYLSGDDSNGSPMIYCDSSRGIGEQVAGHIDNILNNRRFSVFREEYYSVR